MRERSGATAARVTGAGVWRPGQVRRGPALVVLGLGAALAIGGFLLSAFSSGPQATTSGTGVLAAAAGLRAASAHGAIATIASAGEPPGDIVDALVVPSGSTVTGHAREDRGVAQFDRSVTLDAPASASRVVAFYRTELKRAGWHVAGADATADGRGTRIFATRAGADGYYWEVGVTVEPRTPALSPALAGDAASPTSSLDIRLFVVDSAS